MGSIQSGLTLIELTVAIVLIAILALTAAPQFFSYSSDASRSQVQGVAASLSTGSDLTYSKAVIDGIETEASGSIDYHGQDVRTILGRPSPNWGQSLGRILQGDITYIGRYVNNRDIIDVECSNDLCAVDALDMRAIDASVNTWGSAIYPRGYRATDLCLAFYVLDSESTTRVGTEIEGC
ncbi:prepilin-type N-terminal cleavage/methylation domain-containing protein [Vibrio sp. RE86]|uniref:pilus assembly FimT family protein n=1 Tax=Vibrio sp. RE86 TaxID=2607605 RepID=UPI0014935437|nr:prepilin-type N-terminal cleavage/methylation domain-containing protein [Vibrio sp. RE86]NOH79075.1 prepilin-type N-terminal cleavage/methylation domain-containing protein [Vibrio sp. RE86]